MKLAIAILAGAVLLTGTSLAAPKACTCKNLETLQHEVVWAEYMRDGYARMAAELEAIEKQVDAENERDNQGIPPEQRTGLISASSRTGPVWDSRIRELGANQPPGGTSSGAHIIPGTCRNGEGEYAKLLESSPCAGIGKLLQAHEDGHIATCNKMGATPYTLRRHSVMAMEESQSYATQAKAMREELKRVIDGSSVEIETLLEPVLSGQGIRVVYKYEMKRAKLNGKSSPGSDEWDLKGEGTRTGTIESVTMPGMRCTSSGALKDAVSVKLSMDGFTMGLDVQSVSTPGDVKLKCSVPGVGQGFGQSMRPMGEGGNGQVFEGKPVQLETEHREDLAAGPVGKVMAGSGMSFTGEEITKLTISCKAQ